MLTRLQSQKNFSKAIIVGGKANVSLNVEKQLKAMKTARYAGMNHYEHQSSSSITCSAGRQLHLPSRRGRDYSDALAGAALCGQVQAERYSRERVRHIRYQCPEGHYRQCGQSGGPGGDNAVSDAMKAAIDNIIK